MDRHRWGDYWGTPVSRRNRCHTLANTDLICRPDILEKLILLWSKAALSPEMAPRLEKAFGLDMDQMLRMQAWFDATVMRERAGEIDIDRYEPEIG